VFLIRLGDQPKGIVASGWCTRKSYRKGGRNYIDLTWDVLSANPVVDLSELQRSPFASFRWIIQASGIEIPLNIARDLSRLWDKRVALNRPKRANGAETAVEGLAREATILMRSAIRRSSVLTVFASHAKRALAPFLGEVAFESSKFITESNYLYDVFPLLPSCRGIMRELSRPRPH